MSLNNRPVLVIRALSQQRELENLYARRVKINELIKKLEDYDRLRAKVIRQDRKTA